MPEVENAPDVGQAALQATGQELLMLREAQARDQVRQAALRCARTLQAYIRENPGLLFAETLPIDEGEDLRNCLTGYVRTLRAMRSPPERVVLAVKELVRNAAVECRVQSRSLIDAAVKWAIVAYFPAGDT